MVFLEDSWTELMVLPLHAGGNWTPESIRSQTNEVVNLNQHRLVYLSGACIMYPSHFIILWGEGICGYLL